MKASLLALLRLRGYTFSFVSIALVAVASLLGLRLRAHDQASNYTSAASSKDNAYHNHDSQHGEYPPGTIKGEAVDAARAGMLVEIGPHSDPSVFPGRSRRDRDDFAGQRGERKSLTI